MGTSEADWSRGTRGSCIRASAQRGGSFQRFLTCEHFLEHSREVNEEGSDCGTLVMSRELVAIQTDGTLPYAAVEVDLPKPKSHKDAN